MHELITFIRAQLDKEEARIRDPRYMWQTDWSDIAAPERLLADIAAKRAIVDAAAKADEWVRVSAGATAGYARQIISGTLHAIEAIWRCCDLHGHNCEPEEPCCENCTEVHHAGWRDDRGIQRFGHPAGEACLGTRRQP